MSSRNQIKNYIPETHYHIYNRGIDKGKIFIHEYDYSVFLNLLKRYLGKKEASDNKGREYESLNDRIELLAFCLMPNHFHLLIYQKDETAMTRLLRGLCISYSAYFNKRYQRTGPLFNERFKACNISRDEYLLHISRYIHLNPQDYEQWEFSSLPYYLGSRQASWVKPGRILELFNGPQDYRNFLGDYEGHKNTLDEIKFEMANSAEL